MASQEGKDRARDIGTGRPPAENDAAAATASNPPAGGTGAQGGCYDTAANRNLAITSLTACITDLNTMRSELKEIGIVAGSVTNVGKTRARDIGSGKVPKFARSVTATALAPPAGGTGQTVGGYDNATNRDAFITSLTALIADIASFRAEMKAIALISGSTTLAGRARLRDLGSGRTPALNVSIAATASAPPVGGSGANAGGYDTSGNRDLMITSLTAARTDIGTLRAELVALNLVLA